MTKNVEWSYIHAARGCQELVLIFRAQIGNLTLKSWTLLSSKYGHIPKLPKTKKVTNEKWPYICALWPAKRIFWYLIIGISYSVSMFKKRYITRFFQNGPTCYWFNNLAWPLYLAISQITIAENLEFCWILGTFYKYLAFSLNILLLAEYSLFGWKIGFCRIFCIFFGRSGSAKYEKSCLVEHYFQTFGEEWRGRSFAAKRAVPSPLPSLAIKGRDPDIVPGLHFVMNLNLLPQSIRACRDWMRSTSFLQVRNRPLSL